MGRIIIGVALALTIAASAGPGRAADSQELMAAAAAIGRSYDENYNAGNAAGMAALYAEDATFVSPVATIAGRPAIEAYYRGRFAAGATGHTTRIVSVQPMGEGGYGIGQFSVHAPGPDGQMRELHGNLVTIYQHEGGAWHMRLLIASLAPPK